MPFFRHISLISFSNQYFMKIKFMALFGCFFLYNLTFSQSATLIWQKTYGGTSLDFADRIITTSDGGFISVGTVSSNNNDVSGFHGGESDIWVFKSDLNGNIQWQKCIGGSLGEYSPRVKQTIDGGFIIVFSTESFDGDIINNQGSVDVGLVKLNASGSIEWLKTYGGSGSDMSSGIIQDSDGGFIGLGSTISNDGDVFGNNGDYDAWIFKVDALGTLLWQNCIGGNSSDGLREIEATTDGGFILIGSTQSNSGIISGYHGSSDLWVVKLSPNGSLQWNKCFGGTSADNGFAIEQMDSGDYIMIGSTQSNDGDVSGNHSFFADFWILKINQLGNLIWQKCIGGSEQDFGYDILKTNNNTYLIAGTAKSSNGDMFIGNGDYDYWVGEIDTNGLLLNSHYFGGTSVDDFKSMDKTSDGKFILLGNTPSNNGYVTGNHGGTDLWAVKFCFPIISYSEENVIDSITINGQTYTETGIYYDSVPNVNGCDSIFILNLTVSHSGIIENGKDVYSIYPNPTSDFLTISGINTTDFEYVFLDVSGRKLFEGKSNVIDLRGFATGFYVVRIESNNSFRDFKILKN
jgi:hypothetical protein